LGGLSVASLLAFLSGKIDFPNFLQMLLDLLMSN